MIPASAMLPDRSLSPELMDGSLAYDEARRALADLDRVNRLLLGVWAARKTVVPRLVPEGRDGSDARPPVSFLDLGTGSGSLAGAVARAAERRGRRVRLVGLDRRLTHLVVGRELPAGGSGSAGTEGLAPLRVAASVDALPFRDGAFDWTVSNLLFHHFDGATNLGILAEMRRVARCGAVVVDLRRSRLAVWLARAVFPLLGVGRIARHDGVLSLRQSWTVREVRELVAALPVVELKRRFPFRWSLVVRSNP